MSSVRNGTLVVDFSVLPERPKLEHVQRFVEKSLGLDPTDFTSVQLHNIRHCMLIKMADPAAAIWTASKHHLKHAFRINPTLKIAIPVYVDDDTVDVRVHDLPPELPNSKIVEAMMQYGEVLTIRDEVWRNFFAGVPNGVRVLKMKLSKPVPSYVTVCGLTSLATHTSQIATCRRCGQKKHASKNCVEAAKQQKNQGPKKQNDAPLALSVLPPTDLAVVESRVIPSHTEGNDNDGFTIVGKQGKVKRPLLEGEKKESEQKRTCLDDDDTPILDNGNDHGNNNGQQKQQLPGESKTPKRRLLKKAT